MIFKRDFHDCEHKNKSCGGFDYPINGPFNSCSDLVPVRIVSRRKLAVDRLVAGMVGMRKLAVSGDRLASGIASSAVLPSRVHF